AHSTKLDQTALQAIAERVADRFPSELASAPDSNDEFELAETFDVYTLRPSSGTDLAAAAVPTGTLHQQLYVNGKPVGYVRSRKNARGEWEVTEVLKSTLAARIAAAIEELDASVVEDSFVRLLVVPDYHVAALWIECPRNRCYVLASPASFKDLTVG